MQQAIRQLLERSFEAYRSGRYLALMGPSYADYVSSQSTDSLIDDLLQQDDYLPTLETAFVLQLQWILEKARADSAGGWHGNRSQGGRISG